MGAGQVHSGVGMNRVEEALGHDVVRGDASTRRDAMRCVRERWCGACVEECGSAAAAVRPGGGMMAGGMPVELSGLIRRR